MAQELHRQLIRQLIRSRADDPDLSILIAYAPDVETELGGSAAVTAKAGQLVADLNSAISDSGISGTTVKVAGTVQASRTFQWNEVVML